MKLNTLATTMLLIGVSMGLSAAATAGQPQIVQTDCDTLSTDPHLVQIEFALINNSSLHVCQIDLTPLGDTPWEDPCAINQCGSSPEWECSLGPVGGAARWHVAIPGEEEIPGVPPGGQSTGLTFTEGEGTCCYWANYYTCGTPEPFHTEVVCFECDQFVQVQAGTWGALKAIYR